MQRVSSILSVHEFPQVNFKSLLPLLLCLFSQEKVKSFGWQNWQILVPLCNHLFIQLKELRVALKNWLRDPSWLVYQPSSDQVECIAIFSFGWKYFDLKDGFDFFRGQPLLTSDRLRSIFIALDHLFQLYLEFIIFNWFTTQLIRNMQRLKSIFSRKS